MNTRFLLCLLVLPFSLPGALVVETDVCVYGGASGGVVAAVQAARMGKSVSLAIFGTHLGGLTSGGLGATDVGNVASIGGVSREFYRRIGQRYGVSERFNFEPHVARAVYADWLAENSIVPRYNQRLASVTRSGLRITELRMEDGTLYRAKMFIDATYEGDLMALAGVSFTFGREGTNVYNESLNGIRASTPAHQFPVNVDPYVVPGNPGSGLLPFVQPGDGGVPGDGDQRIQAFNYRLCLTQNATNRLPHAVPPNYDPARYELLGRLLDARVANGDTLTIASFFNVSSMPNGKTDMNNNGAFSTDYIGMNWTYPTNSYEARAQMDQDHLEYIQGLVQYLATSPRSPAALRAQMLTWGPCKDEWQETGGYSPQIYVREARRMISDYVMIQADCQSTRIANDSVCLGSYNMDSHNCQRIVKAGFARNEGDVQVGSPKPYPIAYRSIVPRVGECENLFVIFAISASHIAFGSTRMEPVFMMAGQSAATAAAFAINDQVPVQQVDYSKLALQLTADGQILRWGSPAADSGIIVDNADPGASYTGTWSNSTAIAGFWGANYAHDGNTAKGAKIASFTPNLPAPGQYEVFLRWTSDPNRATNVPVDVVHASGTNTFVVNQQLSNSVWVSLITTNFAAGTNSPLQIRTAGSSGFVIADAARWRPTVDTNVATAQLIASDPIASETGKTARVLFSRSAVNSDSPLALQYELGGTASNGVDVASLSGNIVFSAGSLATNLAITAPADTLAEGDKTLILTLKAGTNYSLGAFTNATVRVLDSPFDGWRFEHFSGAELSQTNLSGANADPDQDGASNWQEFIAGTDPRNGASALRVKLDLVTNTAVISFLAGSNHSYTLQFRQDPAGGAWLDFTNVASAASNHTVVCIDPLPTGVTNRLYRVRTP
jgi:hypothetical protein